MQEKILDLAFSAIFESKIQEKEKGKNKRKRRGKHMQNVISVFNKLKTLAQQNVPVIIIGIVAVLIFVIVLKVALSGKSKKKQEKQEKQEKREKQEKHVKNQKDLNSQRKHHNGYETENPEKTERKERSERKRKKPEESRKERIRNGHAVTKERLEEAENVKKAKTERKEKKKKAENQPELYDDFGNTDIDTEKYYQSENSDYSYSDQLPDESHKAKKTRTIGTRSEGKTEPELKTDFREEQNILKKMGM